jgi:hypothetical protein
MSFGKSTHEGKARRRLSDNRKKLPVDNMESAFQETDDWYPRSSSVCSDEDSSSNTSHCEDYDCTSSDVLTGLDPIVNAGGALIPQLLHNHRSLEIPRRIKDWLDGKLPQGPTPVNTKDSLGTTPIFSHLDTHTIASLVEQGVIKPCKRNHISNYIHCFFVSKANNKSRFIGHPKTLNLALKGSPEIPKVSPCHL